jgi:uncharacterized protein (UPF0218 family)
MNGSNNSVRPPPGPYTKCIKRNPILNDIITIKNEPAKVAFEVLKNVEKKNAKMTSTFEKINIINNI